MGRSSHKTSWRGELGAFLHGLTRTRGNVGTHNVKLDDTSPQTLAHTARQNAFAMVSEESGTNLSRKERRQIARKVAKKELKSIRSQMQAARAAEEIKAKAQDPATLVKPATVQETQKFGRIMSV